MNNVFKFVAMIVCIIIILTACVFRDNIISSEDINNKNNSITSKEHSNPISNVDTLPTGCIKDTVKANPEDKEINIKQLDGDNDIDMSGTWHIYKIEITGAKKKKDNKIEEFEKGTYSITINPDGTGCEILDGVKNNFKWRYVVKDTHKVGLEYELDSGDRWQLFFKEVIYHQTVLLKKMDRNGGDDKYGDSFTRSIYLWHDMDGKIEIVSNGETVKPTKVWASSNTYGLCADAGPINWEEFGKELECIKYADDFTLITDGKELNTPRFTVYDTNLERLIHNIDSLDGLTKQGEYIIYVALGWGNSDFKSGYKFYFKLLVE